jgi:hypothetical protein
VSSHKVTAKQRQTVSTRAEQCCEYCYSQVEFSPQSFSVEHIIPRNKQGQTTLENLALSCQGCNNFKHTKTEGIDPITERVVSLYHPLVIGLTPTGRATTRELKLNRAGVINLRRVLFAMSQHPPLNSLPSS